MTAPAALVGITTRNRASILPKALTSARAQTHSNLKIAVLDDGSTDTTPNIRDLYPEIYWQRHELPHGIIESRNELMSGAGADYYVSLDDDAWFLKGDEVELAIRRMEQYPEIAAIAFDILSPDRPDAVSRTAPRPAAMFIGCGHVLRLSAVRNAGFYASSPGTYGSEEKDLSLRLLDIGFTIEKMPGVHVWHDKAWSDRDWYPLHRSGVCNELAMTLRRCPAPDVALVLPLKLLSYLRYWIRKPQYLRAGISGLGSFLGHVPKILATRQPVRRQTFWASTRNRSE